MEIQVNGEHKVSDTGDLAALLKELGYSGEAFAVAVNGDFVPRAQYTQRQLQHGDRLDVVAPVVGG
ncbi:sulfur carrier protein ThiS [Microbulbifer litoralis]|uniref:sulfur carrier protein ThiS n=1 Tax=Microbulbifer litoralis TaxID=2933965 RepID=UPI0020286E68|nr:sulfur carrier protein ThiS [Microbulbifer sp. GX H0434]